MPCDPKDIALKSFFLGPQAENGPWIEGVVSGVLRDWFQWRRGRFPADGRAISESDIRIPEFQERRQNFEARLGELTARFEKEVPKFSPRYVGHMFSEISLPAILGHLVALFHNPNLISGESARIGVEIEEEALSYLARMSGYSAEAPAGHFTSGGTVANFEALLRARARLALWLSAGAATRAGGKPGSDLFSAAHCGWKAFRGLEDDAKTSEWNFTQGNPFEVGAELERIFGSRFLGPVALIPESRHYSWKKGLSFLGLGETALWPVALDGNGKLSLPHLDSLLKQAQSEQRPVLMVVSVAGSTELGSIDPVHEVQGLLDSWAERGIHIWHHVDAAFGGFLRSIGASSFLSKESKLALASLGSATSITLDPHKLGYVPYSCGAFLCRENQDYSVQAFGAPYVQNTAQERGLFTLEGTRAGTGAAATWMTARTIGLDPEGYGRILERTLRIKHALEAALSSGDPRVRIAQGTDTNILAFTWAEKGARLSHANAAAERIFESLSPSGKGPFFVSKTHLSLSSYGAFLDRFFSSFEARIDAQALTVVRVCTMNPFFDSLEMNTDFSSKFVSAVLSAVR